MACSTKPTKVFTWPCMHYTLWLVIALYSAIMISFYFWMCFTYPGYVNDNSTDEFYSWLESPFNEITINTLHSVWLVLNLFSCAITIYAI